MSCKDGYIILAQAYVVKGLTSKKLLSCGMYGIHFLGAVDQEFSE